MTVIAVGAARGGILLKFMCAAKVAVLAANAQKWTDVLEANQKWPSAQKFSPKTNMGPTHAHARTQHTHTNRTRNTRPTNSQRASQPTIVTFGLAAIIAAIATIGESDQEGEHGCDSDQEGEHESEHESSDESHQKGGPLLPPGLGVTHDSIHHPVTPSTQRRPIGRLAIVRRLSPPSGSISLQLSARRSRQSARSAEYGRRREQQTNAVCAAPAHQWLSFFIAGSFYHALRLRVVHRRCVLTRCMLILHPQCRTFIDRLRVGRRLMALRRIAKAPRPVGFGRGTGLYDVGYDETSRQFSYRDVSGAISDRHPASAAGISSADIPAYTSDGTTTQPVFPPSASSVVLCPESSGAWCYYDTADGSASWYPPSPSLPLHTHKLHDAHSLLPSRPPPRIDDSIQMNALRFTGWHALYSDATNEISLVHMSTGCVRQAPWISLRTSGGTIYFANLVSRETRWLPPPGWMEGWTARRPIDEWQNGMVSGDQHPHGHLQLDRSVDHRLPLVGIYGRQCVEGGAPYLHEYGRPQYPPDEFDTPSTYPLDGFIRVVDRRNDQLSNVRPSGVRWLSADTAHSPVPFGMSRTTSTPERCGYLSGYCRPPDPFHSVATPHSLSEPAPQVPSSNRSVSFSLNAPTTYPPHS